MGYLFSGKTAKFGLGVGRVKRLLWESFSNR